jgi:hypothetical protein
MGTVVTILVADGVPEIVAVVPLNFTVLLAAVVLKFVPVIVIEVPTLPDVGLNKVMVGEFAGDTVKSFALVAVRPATSTVIFPVVAPVGTFVTMLVAVGVPVITAVTPLNFTRLLAAVVLKLLPVKVTGVPIGPDIGLNDVMAGGNTRVKSVGLIAICPTTSTVILPVVAPKGTVVVMLVAELAVTVAVAPLNCTTLLAGVALKLVPVMVTVVPTEPVLGVKEVIVGVTMIVSEMGLE